MMRLRFRGAPAVAAGLVFLTTACSSKSCGGSASADNRPKGSLEHDSAIVQNQPQHAREFVDSLSNQDTDLDALAAALKTPEAATEFVREQIAFEPYRGILKGARGTLISRGGNAIDRALLLAALLQRNGMEPTIAHRQLTAAEADAILADATRRPDAVTLINRSMSKAAESRSVTPEKKNAVIGDALNKVNAQAANRDASLAELQKALKSSPASSRPTDTAAIRDHYWVQATTERGITDLDPTAPAGTPRLQPPADTFPASGPPDALYQRISVKIVVDRVDNGSVSSEDVAELKARAADAVGELVRVVIAPKSLTRDQNEFVGGISIGKQARAGGKFDLSSQPAAASGAGGLLGGLEGASADEPSRLGRVSVEFASTGPDMSPAQYRRVIVDRIETQDGHVRIRPDMADDADMRMFLLQSWDGALDVGPLHPRYLMESHAAFLESQQQMQQRALAAKYQDQPFSVTDFAPPELSPTVLGFYYFSAISQLAARLQVAPTVRSYHLRPRLAFERSGIAVHDWSNPGKGRRFQRSLDLINAPFGFMGPAADATALAVRAGVADAELERSLALGAEGFNTLSLMQQAGGEKQKLSAYTNADSVKALNVPEPVRDVLRKELTQHRVIVAPSGLVTLAGVRTFGWWSLDPESGVPLGQMELGAGQGAVETSKLTQSVMDMSTIVINFYGGLLSCFYQEAATQLGGDGPPPAWSNIPMMPKMPGPKPLGACVAEVVCQAVAAYASLAATSVSLAIKIPAEEAANHLIEMLFDQLGEECPK